MPRSKASMERTAARYKAKQAKQDPLNPFDAVTETACRAVGINYAPRRVSVCTTPDQAVRDVGNKALPVSWDVEELSAVVPPPLRYADRPAFEGQCRANGRPL